MKTIIDLILVAFITIYIVDLSGFTDSWRAALAKALRVKELKQLPPFDCSLCMVWWVCLIFLLVAGKCSIPMVAFSALLSLMSVPFGQLLILLREGFIKLVNKLMEVWRI